MIKQAGLKPLISVVLATIAVSGAAARPLVGLKGAGKVLEEAFARMDAKSWPAPLVKYLRADIGEKDLLALATDNDKMTEARAYVGMSLALEGRLDAARTHLEWVVKNGNRDFIEYGLAKSELRRINQ
jgi:lipoprotein NlpI